jgi:hypothetical protein
MLIGSGIHIDVTYEADNDKDGEGSWVYCNGESLVVFYRMH